MTDTPKRRNDQREHRLQAFADKFIDRVVLPPMFTTGIDAAAQATPNQRARAAGRGIKFGLPDCFVAQGDGVLQVLAFIEYKRGSGLTGRQEGVHIALRRVGIPVYIASTIGDLFEALKFAGFRLHGNAANIAVEVEEKLLAADRKKVGVRRAGAAQSMSKARVARGAAIYARAVLG